MNNYNGKVAYVADVATEYDRIRVVEKSWQQEERILSFIFDEFIEPRHSSVVLDVPAGTGRFFGLYDRLNLKVQGIDISDSMLEVARTKVPSEKSADFNLLVGDAASLKGEDNSVDVAVCFRLIHLLPKDVVRNVVAELCRVSKKGIVIHGFSMLEIESISFKLKRLIKRLLSKGTLVAKGSGDFSHISTFQHDEKWLISEFKKSGFSLRACLTVDESDLRTSWRSEPSSIYYFERENV